MITFLDGKLVNALPTQAIVDVGGVGYEVFIPLSSYDKLPAVGQPIRILTHLAVREDAHVLYGFMTPAERDLFRLLVNSVSGIGPKLALAVLSGMSVTSFKAAVVNSDVAAISKISGLGKKTAERIVLELKDKLGVAAAWEAASATHAPTPEQEQANEAVLGLIALGYKQVDAHKAVHDLQQKGEAEISGRIGKAGTEANSRRQVRRKRRTLNVQRPMSNSDSAFGVGRSALGVGRLLHNASAGSDRQTVRNPCSFPKEGLFAEKEWLLSPDAFPIDRKSLADLEQLGHRLFVFQRACNQLYQLSVKGKQPEWVARYLDAGKPKELIEFSRRKEIRDDLPRVIRPDLILTEKGYIIAEIDSVPGGIGLTGWLNQTYSSFDNDIIGGANGMLEGFRAVVPNGADIVISQESATYRPEMEWLVARLNQTSNSNLKALTGA